MGREGHRFTRKEAQEAEGVAGGAGEGPISAEHSDKVCDHPAESRRQTASVAQKGSPSRHLLPSVALARPAEPPRAEAAGAVRVCLQQKQQGSLHQSLPLPPSGDSGWVCECVCVSFFVCACWDRCLPQVLVFSAKTTAVNGRVCPKLLT